MDEIVNKASNKSLNVGKPGELQHCTTKVQYVKATIGGHVVVLVDTPGFDYNEEGWNRNSIASDIKKLLRNR